MISETHQPIKTSVCYSELKNDSRDSNYKKNLFFLTNHEFEDIQMFDKMFLKSLSENEKNYYIVMFSCYLNYPMENYSNVIKKWVVFTRKNIDWLSNYNDTKNDTATDVIQSLNYRYKDCYQPGFIPNKQHETTILQEYQKLSLEVRYYFESFCVNQDLSIYEDQNQIMSILS